MCLGSLCAPWPGHASRAHLRAQTARPFGPPRSVHCTLSWPSFGPISGACKLCTLLGPLVSGLRAEAAAAAAEDERQSESSVDRVQPAVRVVGSFGREIALVRSCVRLRRSSKRRSSKRQFDERRRFVRRISKCSPPRLGVARLPGRPWQMVIGLPQRASAPGLALAAAGERRVETGTGPVGGGRGQGAGSARDKTTEARQK